MAQVERGFHNPHDNPEVCGSQGDEWDDKTIHELEKLLTDHLHAHFKHAITTIVRCGYKEHDAETAILRSRPSHGNTDIVSRIINSALASVNIEKEPHATECHVFESLESLVKYTLLEMICSLREVKPSLTLLEAMWLIFMWDFNLSNACTKEIGPYGSSSQATTEEKYTEPTSTKYTPRTTESNDYPIPRSALKLPVTGGQSIRLTVDCAQQMSESLHVIADKVQNLYQRSGYEENPGWSRKLSSGNYEHEMPSQKEYLHQRIYKGSTSKGTFKAKSVSFKSVSGSSGPIMKNSRSKISTSSGSVSENIYNHKTDSTSLMYVADTPNIMKDANFDKPSSSAIPSYYAGIPYDTTLKKYIPQDEKDEAIVELVPHLQKLQKNVGALTDWASEKFEQGMTRIQEVKAEIKTIKQQVGEQFANINVHTKRYEDMDQALAGAYAMLESRNAAIHRLVTEKNTLILEMKSAEGKALESEKDLQKALQQEKEALKNSKSIDLEKRLLEKESTSLKRNNADWVPRLEKAKARLKQFEYQDLDALLTKIIFQDLWKNENKEKLKYLLQAENLRVERKQLVALAKVEEKAMKERSRCDIEKCREEIKNLEAEISVLKLESQVLKITEFETSTAMDATDKKRERECVVCLAEERSVLFLPCAHQVVCTQCSMQYEKEMYECPSCRTPIQRRIQVRFRTSE